MKTLILTLFLVPSISNAIVVSHSEPTVRPPQNCDYSVSVEGTNRMVWRCFTEKEYIQYTQEKEQQRQVHLEIQRTDDWNRFKNNYFLLPIGVLLFFLAIALSSTVESAAFVGVLSVAVIFAGVLRAVYQIFN